MAKKLLVAVGFVLALGLAGCGYTPGQRALSGGAIGAGGGALVGEATGTDPVTDALIGGALGALGGAVTAPDHGGYWGHRGYYGGWHHGYY